MRYRIVGIGLVLLGSIQMLGDLSGNAAIKGIGAASHASPAPKVFTAHRGFETFSSRFYIETGDGSGGSMRTELTPQRYSALKGPYNRRNAYGAALSYGPVLMSDPLTVDMFEAVSTHALCRSSVLDELGIERHRGSVRVLLVPRDAQSGTGDWQLEYEVTCDE